MEVVIDKKEEEEDNSKFAQIFDIEEGGRQVGRCLSLLLAQKTEWEDIEFGGNGRC